MLAWSTRLWPVTWTAFCRHCSWPQNSEMHSTSEKLDFAMVVKYWSAYELKYMLFYYCQISAGSLKSLRKIRSPVSLTSCRDCLFFCRQVKNEQLRRQMLHGALAGTAVRVRTAALLSRTRYLCACSLTLVYFLAWQQHDVQELCRVMFDALEQKWKQTEQVEESKFCNLSGFSIHWTKDLLREKWNGPQA